MKVLFFLAAISPIASLGGSQISPNLENNPKPQNVDIAAKVIAADRPIGEQLIEVELQLIVFTKTGAGNKHPRVKSLKSQIKELRQKQKKSDLNIKNFLSERKSLLLAQRKRLRRSLGLRHPKIITLQTQIEFIDAELNKLEN